MNEFDRNVKGLIEYLQCEMHGDEVALTQCSRLRTVKSESVVPARTSPDSFIVRTFAELRKNFSVLTYSCPKTESTGLSLPT